MHTLHDFYILPKWPTDGTITIAMLCTVQDELEVHADHRHSWPSHKYIQHNYFISTIGSSSHTSIVSTIDCYSAFHDHFCADFVPQQECCIYWIMNMYHCCGIISLRHRQNEKTVSNMKPQFLSVQFRWTLQLWKKPTKNDGVIYWMLVVLCWNMIMS